MEPLGIRGWSPLGLGNHFEVALVAYLEGLHCTQGRFLLVHLLVDGPSLVVMKVDLLLLVVDLEDLQLVDLEDCTPVPYIATLDLLHQKDQEDP